MPNTSPPTAPATAPVTEPSALMTDWPAAYPTTAPAAAPIIRPNNPTPELDPSLLRNWPRLKLSTNMQTAQKVKKAGKAFLWLHSSCRFQYRYVADVPVECKKAK